MREGTCPKCGQASIFEYRGSGPGVSYDPYGNSPEVEGLAWLGGRTVERVLTYLCVGCGYFENYVADPDILARVSNSKNWQRVAPS